MVKKRNYSISNEINLDKIKEFRECTLYMYITRQLKEKLSVTYDYSFFTTL